MFERSTFKSIQITELQTHECIQHYEDEIIPDTTNVRLIPGKEKLC